jgi:hypothetical protein
MTHDTESERGQFEAWAGSDESWIPNLNRDRKGVYMSLQTAAAWHAWQSAVASRPSPVAQDGDWVMVPREPTVEMILAAVEANQRIPRRKGSPPTVMEIMTAEYKAYLAAAPLSAPKADEEKP